LRYVSYCNFKIGYKNTANSLPAQKLEPNFPSLPLHHGEVDPEKGELFHQGNLIVSPNIIAFGKTGIKRKLPATIRIFPFAGALC
jgi:hypothetical protein